MFLLGMSPFTFWVIYCKIEHENYTWLSIMKICIAEDKEELRNKIERDLIDAGYIDIYAFESTRLAIQSLEENRYDILVTDIDLGDERRGGFRLFKEVLKENPEASVLFISGLDEAPDLQEIVLGMDYDFLGKPFTSGTLIRMVSGMEKQQLEKNSLKTILKQVGPIEYIKEHMEYCWNKRIVRLSSTHKKLVNKLLEKAGEVIPRKEFMFALMSGKNAANLQKHMSQIRQLFKDIDHEFDRVEAKSGGWMWKI